MLLHHHDPTRTDAVVAGIERSFGYLDGVTVEAAREGTTITIG